MRKSYGLPLWRLASVIEEKICAGTPAYGKTQRTPWTRACEQIQGMTNAWELLPGFVLHRRYNACLIRTLANQTPTTLTDLLGGVCAYATYAWKRGHKWILKPSRQLRKDCWPNLHSIPVAYSFKRTVRDSQFLLTQAKCRTRPRQQLQFHRGPRSL